jgi:hypothetical protein
MLVDLRRSLVSMDRSRKHYLPGLCLLALLGTIALDVPGDIMSPYRKLQPTLHAHACHLGQQLLFALPRCDWTILALQLMAEYRPLLLANDRLAALHAIKAAPYITLAKQVAADLGYERADDHLMQAMDTGDAEMVEQAANECINWARLTTSQRQLSGMLRTSADDRLIQQPGVDEGLGAVRRALDAGYLSADFLLPYASVLTATQAAKASGQTIPNWRNLTKLGDAITGSEVLLADEKIRLDGWLAERSEGLSHTKRRAILELAETQRNAAHTYIVAQCLFFCIMAGALQSSQASVRPEDAMDISKHIIDQLTAHDESDPNRPTHRRFLETFGGSRVPDLERVLTSFASATDSLMLDGISYVPPTRQTAGRILYVCKELVETNVAKLKGWGGLDDNIDLQMVLFKECARKLEALHHSSSTTVAMANGCLFTASAKLVRSLHSILQGFKQDVALSQLQQSPPKSASSHTISSSTPVDAAAVEDLTQAPNWDGLLDENPFVDWESWPHFDPSDFSDLFGDAFMTGPIDNL